MRRLLLTAALIASPACADTGKQADQWELTYQALNLIDGVQTIDCTSRHVCREGNTWVYGDNPSPEKIVAIKTGFGVAHYLIFRLLKDHDPKAARLFSQVSVVVQGSVVAANLRFAF